MSKSKRQKTQAADELMEIARAVLARLDANWFAAFNEMAIAEIKARREPEKRARVEAAGKVAHAAAAEAYNVTYKRVLAEEMSR